MATRTVEQTTSPADHPFEIRIDSLYFHGLDDAPREPALIINPKASLDTLLAAVHRRADCLHKNINAWSCAGVEGAEVKAPEVADMLEPLANEIVVLVEAISSRECWGEQ